MDGTDDYLRQALRKLRRYSMNTIITTTVWCNYTVSCALICFYDCGPSIIQHQMSVNAKMFIMSLDFSEIIINNVYYELRFQ